MAIISENRFTDCKRRSRHLQCALATLPVAFTLCALFAGCGSPAGADPYKRQEPDDTEAGTGDDDSQTPPASQEQALEPVETSVSPAAEPDAGATWCTGQSATFCADFDRELSVGWTARANTHAETSLVQDGTSAPNSLGVVTEVVGDGTIPRAYLRKDFAEAPDEVSYSFDVRIDQMGVTGRKGGTLALLKVGTEPAHYELQVNAYATGKVSIMERGPSINGGARKYVRHDVGVLPLDVWTRVNVSVHLGATSTFSASLGDAKGLTDITCLMPLPKVAPSFYLGMTYADPPSEPWKVRYDNVLVTLR